VFFIQNFYIEFYRLIVDLPVSGRNFHASENLSSFHSLQLISIPIGCSDSSSLSTTSNSVFYANPLPNLPSKLTTRHVKLLNINDLKSPFFFILFISSQFPKTLARKTRMERVSRHNIKADTDTFNNNINKKTHNKKHKHKQHKKLEERKIHEG
jgi:hypothetical protein